LSGMWVMDSVHLRSLSRIFAPCFLTDNCYRSDNVSSRKNIARMGAVCKRQIGSLWLRDGPKKHFLNVIDLGAQGNKI